jgi:26S proteasome regulatory subunit N9
MDAPSPALEAQRKEHPDLGEQIDLLQKYANAKLYHQLTQTLLQYIVSAPFAPGKAGAAEALMGFFNGFIKDFENKFDKVRWVEILAIVCKPQKPEEALELIAAFEASVSKKETRDAKYLLMSLKAEYLVLSGKLDEAKEVLETVGTEIDAAYEVDALIQSHFHQTYALLWKKLGRYQEFYRSSLLFMAFTPVAKIPAADRPQIAYEVAIAALVAAEEFDFGELLQQELLAALDGSEYEWIKDLLKAYGEGKFEMYDAAMAKQKAKIDAVPELKGAVDSVLRPKMAALALMELAFSKPKKQRRLSFEELAQHSRVGPKEVEHLVMKAMSAKLIKGKIDEVQKIVIITWVKPRILDSVRIDLMRERMDAWAAQTGMLLDHIEDLTPELLVS